MKTFLLVSLLLFFANCPTTATPNTFNGINFTDTNQSNTIESSIKLGEEILNQ